MSSYGPPSRQILKKDFRALDYYHLAKDDLARFAPSFDYAISYALVCVNNATEPVAYQFAFPPHIDANSPSVKTLKSISLDNSLQNNVILAVTEDNIEMRTQRVITVKTHSILGETNTYKLLFFSPASTYTSNQNLTWPIEHHFRHSEPIFDSLEKKQASLDVNYHNILYRYHHQTIPEENNSAIMGGSATEAYISFHEQYGDTLPFSYNRMALKSILAGNPYNLKSSLHSFKRPEWCHALAKSFHPENRNPQIKDNIGAAPFWMNSQMMIIEESLRWHARTYPNAKITLKSTFNIFPNTHVVASGKMKAKVRTDFIEICVIQNLEPFQLFPAYPKSTDIAITTFIMNSLIIDKCRTLISIQRQEIPQTLSLSSDASPFYLTNDDDIEQLMLQIPESQLQATSSSTHPEYDDDEIEQIMLQIPEAVFHAQTCDPQIFPLETPSLTLTPARSLHALADKRAKPDFDNRSSTVSKQARIL